MAKKKKDEKEKKAKVHGELDGFKIEIDQFGEINSSFSIDKINTFLDKNVEDKKLEEREGKFGEGKDKKKEDKD